MPIKMTDVAQMAGVSIATVSRVLNEPEKVKPETRDRVQQVLDRTGFVANGLARGLVTSSMQAIGVLCDRRDIYDEAMNYFYNGRGNGAMDKAVYYVHPGNLGQWQESGRDQGHNTLGIALMGPFLEAAWNQGDDLYSYDNNRFLAGAEYVAKYNLGNDVPYQPYAWGTGQRGDRQEQPVSGPPGARASRPRLQGA